MIPLYCLENGAKFKIPGRRKVFTKKDNLATFHIQNYDEAGLSTTVATEAACYCKNSSGRTFIKRWWDFVEEV